MTLIQNIRFYNLRWRYNDLFFGLQWDLVCDRLFINDLITTIQMIGMLLGALVGGHVSDAYGRKKSYFISYFLMVTGGLVSAFSPNYQLYAACRFVCGYGFGSTQVINCIYPLEFVGNRWRTLCGTIGFWAMGQMILSLAVIYLANLKAAIVHFGKCEIAHWLRVVVFFLLALCRHILCETGDIWFL